MMMIISVLSLLYFDEFLFSVEPSAAIVSSDIHKLAESGRGRQYNPGHYLLRTFFLLL